MDMTTSVPRLVVEFLAAVLAASNVAGHRGLLDTFADRLVKASSEPTLARAIETLLRAVNASADNLHPPLVAQMVAVAHGPDGPRVLAWWRTQAKLVTLLAATRDPAAVTEALAAVELPPAAGAGAVRPRGDFRIGLTVACEAPLAHGADSKAGNATIFRRMDVLSDAGDVLNLPYYAGNAIRGQMRDLLADHLLASLGLPVSRSLPAVSLWFFYALYSGGALEEKSEAHKAITKAIGDAGALRSVGVREFRTTLPALSLLGCALGNRVLAGRCQMADLRPSCAEWGTGTIPVAELLTWDYLTRREDKEDHLEHHGMIANTEVLRVGTTLTGGIDYDDGISALELSALGRGVRLLADHGWLGAENRRGFGRVRLDVTGAPDPAAYDTFLVEQRDTILAYLASVHALVTQDALV